MVAYILWVVLILSIDLSFSNDWLKIQRLAEKGQTDSITKATFSVMFWMTPEFNKSFKDKQERDKEIDRIIQLTNEGYINSKIPVQVVRHDIKIHPNMTDNINISSKQLFKNFQVSMSRAALLNCADVAALLVKEFPKGGNAIGKFNQTSTCYNFIALSKNGNALESLGHEIGHNLGADHNIEQKDKDNEEIKGDNHGHLILPKGNGYHTIMAYSYPGHEKQANYYSNPNVNYPDTKQPTGVRGVSNNARVIMANRFLMEACGTDEQDGKCNDCNLHPYIDECKTTCCDTVHFNGTNTKFLSDKFHQHWAGIYTKYKAYPKHNGRDVYKHKTDNRCLFYGIPGYHWQFIECPKITTNHFSMRSQVTYNKCVDSGKLAWHPYEHDTTMGVTCVN